MLSALGDVIMEWLEDFWPFIVFLLFIFAVVAGSYWLLVVRADHRPTVTIACDEGQNPNVINIDRNTVRIHCAEVGR